MFADDTAPWSAGEEARTLRSTRLLVSVRDDREAISALAGGCDVLDLKDPAAGPLGRAGQETLRGVLRAAAEWGAETGRIVPVTVALGEAAEAPPPEDRLPAGVAAFKLGLAGLGSMGVDRCHRAATGGVVEADEEDWVARFRFRVEGVRGDIQSQAVVVAYADWEAALSPAPERVISGARAAGAAGVLIDTWDKSGPGLCGLYPMAAIARWQRAACAAGLCFALAGRLTADDVARLAQGVPADVIGVRSAACGGDRTGTVTCARVAALKALLTTPRDVFERSAGIGG